MYIALVPTFDHLCSVPQLCNAYTELNDPVVQRQRFADQLKVIITIVRNWFIVVSHSFCTCC